MTVKRYDPINSDGTCGICLEDPDYGAYVEFKDYDSLQSLNAELLEALVEVTASLAWNAHGECRAIHDGPIMPSSGAVEMGKAAIAKARSQA